MTDGVAAAVIAAIVSVVVAAGSIIVTFMTTRAALRRDHERQDAEFRRAMTEKLYDRRVATYPGLFGATEELRSFHLANAKDLPEHLAATLVKIDDWLSREGGLILSRRAYRQLVTLRSLLRPDLGGKTDLDDLEQLKNNIWYYKNGLRSAMRADLGLLFDEDSIPAFREETMADRSVEATGALTPPNP